MHCILKSRSSDFQIILLTATSRSAEQCQRAVFVLGYGGGSVTDFHRLPFQGLRHFSLSRHFTSFTVCLSTACFNSLPSITSQLPLTSDRLLDFVRDVFETFARGGQDCKIRSGAQSRNFSTELTEAIFLLVRCAGV